MRFIDIITDVESISGIGTGQRAMLRRAISHKLFLYAASYDWPHYRDVGSITTIDDYTTGTVTVTNGSRTVTGSGTTFTALMVGRKIRIASENAFYYIAAFVSATEITLRDPYQGTGQAGASFTLFQDEYKLDANTHKLLDLRQIEDSIMMVGLNYLDMDRWFPDPDTLNDPTYFSMIGRKDDRNTTGTVAVTSGSRTLTGTGTTWTEVPGLTRGTRIAIDDTDEVFTVESIASDTSMTVYETPSTTDASSTMRIFLNNIIVRLMDVPDEARNLYYRKQRVPYPLVNDDDEPDMPRSYHYSLVDAGLITAFNFQGRANESKEAERRWLDWIAVQRSELGIDSPAVNYARRSADDNLLIGVGIGYNRLPPNYGYLQWPS